MAAKSGGSAGLPCMAIAYSARAVSVTAPASASTPQHAMAAARRRDRISIEGRVEARDNEPNLCGREELAAAANLTQRGVYAGFIAPRNCAIWRRGGVTLLPQSASIDPLAGVKAAGVKSAACAATDRGDCAASDQSSPSDGTKSAKPICGRQHVQKDCLMTYRNAPARPAGRTLGALATAAGRTAGKSAALSLALTAAAVSLALAQAKKPAPH